MDVDSLDSVVPLLVGIVVDEASRLSLPPMNDIRFDEDDS